MLPAVHSIALFIASLCLGVSAACAQQAGPLPAGASAGGVKFRFEAAPRRGAAPLTVTFSSYIPGNFSMASGVFTIHFGDGVTAPNPYCHAPANSCVRPGQVTHVYASAGKYTASLVNSLTGTVSSMTIVVEGNPRRFLRR